MTSLSLSAYKTSSSHPDSPSVTQVYAVLLGRQSVTPQDSHSASESIGYSQKYSDLSFTEHDVRGFGYLLTYLIIINKPQTETEQKTQQVLSKPKELGFISKFHLGRFTDNRLLGITINAITMTISVPTSKRRDIRHETERLFNKKKCTLKVLSSLIGQAEATNPAVFPASPKARSFLALKN
ncbi:hypothetical protein RMATCC62417_16563 [Rhizopus microsporus]|nr:hypothetical protein RMATCC62417_16563 [Rhizopus microsporus]